MNKLLVAALCCACVNARVVENHSNDEIHNVFRAIGIAGKDESSVIETSANESTATMSLAVGINKALPVWIDLNIANPPITEVSNGEDKSEVDVGQPLILTPLIDKGKIAEARRASKVNPELFFGLASHSGYLTVNEQYNSNLFFWYFPVPNKPVATTPWLIWLQGGPGASCMTGLFHEIGPVTVDDNMELKLRNTSWGTEHSLLFIENPVGTGFSFTDNELGYAHHVNKSSEQLYRALQQFLQVFPELREAPLFIMGESYAGKYIPGLATEIHRHRDTTHQRINLQGLAIGNGFIEPRSIANYSRVAYNFGLIGAEEAGELKGMEEAFVKLIEANRSVAAKHQWQDTIVSLHLMSKSKQLYNFLKDDLGFRRHESFLRRRDVRRAIHVGAVPYYFVNTTVNEEFATDFLSNARPWLEDLLEHYRVLIYSGHLDVMIPYVLTEENIRTWNWSGKQRFTDAERHPWLSGGRVAGYHKSGGNLTEVVVRGAGHTAPADRPEALRDLIETFVRGRGLPGRVISRDIRRKFIAHLRAQGIYL